MQAFFNQVVLFVSAFIHQGLPQTNPYEEMASWANEDIDLSDKLLGDINVNLLQSITMGSMDKLVSFQLYTRERPNVSTILVPGNLTTLVLSDFDPNKPTKILIDGWLGRSENVAGVCKKLKAEYFLLGSYNVVCVDWSALAFDSLYFTARLRCKAIGDYVAKLITMLIDNTDQTIDDIHIIGFSMGAHIAGYAGKRFDGKVQRITGLDPAKPLFSLKRPNQRLDKNDAQFVDIVHTTYYFLGQHSPFGKIDFYPNSEFKEQPGCKNSSIFPEVCSHLKAYKYYARSIRSKNQFKSVECDKYNKTDRIDLQDCDSREDCSYMGEYASSSNSSGSYCLMVL